MVIAHFLNFSIFTFNFRLNGTRSTPHYIITECIDKQWNVEIKCIDENQGSKNYDQLQSYDSLNVTNFFFEIKSKRSEK